MNRGVGVLGPALEAALDEPAKARLSQMSAEISTDPARVRVLHPAAARVVGRGTLDPADPTGVCGPTLDDAVRGVLLGSLGAALAQRPERLAEEVADLYGYGDADEKRAVLRALPGLEIGDAGVPLVADALRTNDVRLVSAALGAYAGVRLLDEPWRQGVLKCLFVGVPLTAVSRLHERCDSTLATMVASYCHERVAAGRDVPDDVWLVLDRYPAVVDETPLRAELTSEYADRRAAAGRFFESHRSRPDPADQSTLEA